MRLRSLLPLLALVAGCAPAGPFQVASLPSNAGAGAGDPTRGAIFATSYAFGQPGSIAGRPADAAQLAAQLEYLSVEIPNGARWREFSPLTSEELVAARKEMRGTLDVAPDAPPQAVIDALYTASTRLRSADRAGAVQALAVPAFRAGGEATLARLAALPVLPVSAQATQMAQFDLNRMDQNDHSNGGDSGGGHT